MYTEQNNHYLCKCRNIASLSNAISYERLNFLNGKCVKDVDIFIEDGETVRKIRRIIEKRVCQNFYTKKRGRKSNKARYNERHRCANQMKNIYGAVPRGFQFLAVA